MVLIKTNISFGILKDLASQQSQLNDKFIWKDLFYPNLNRLY